MRTYGLLPASYRQGGEQEFWEGFAAVMTGALVGGRPVAIDQAGANRGFLVLTDRQVIVGHMKGLRVRPNPWAAFRLGDLVLDADYPEGVAFEVKTPGPVDLIVGVPTGGLADLRLAMRRLQRS